MDQNNLLDMNNSKLFFKSSEHNYNPKQILTFKIIQNILNEMMDSKYKIIAKNTLLKISIDKYKEFRRFFKTQRTTNDKKLEIYIFISNVISHFLEFKYLFSNCTYINDFTKISEIFYQEMKDKNTDEILKFFYDFINQYFEWPNNLKVNENFNSFFKLCYQIFYAKSKSDNFFPLNNRDEIIIESLKIKTKDKIVILFLYSYLDNEKSEILSLHILNWFMNFYHDENYNNFDDFNDSLNKILFNFNDENFRCKFEFNLFFNKFLIKCNLFTIDEIFDSINKSKLNCSEYFWDEISEFVFLIYKKNNLESFVINEEILKEFIFGFMKTFLFRKELLFNLNLEEFKSISIIIKINHILIYNFIKDFISNNEDNIVINDDDNLTKIKIIFLFSFLLCYSKINLKNENNFLINFSKFLMIEEIDIFIEDLKKETSFLISKDDFSNCDNIFINCKKILNIYNCKTNKNNFDKNISETIDTTINSKTINNSQHNNIKKRIQELIQYSKNKFKSTEEIYQYIIQNINNDPVYTSTSVSFILKSHLRNKIKSILLNLNNLIFSNEQMINTEIKYEKILNEILEYYFNNIDKEDFNYSNIILKIQICLSYNIIIFIYKRNLNQSDNKNISIIIKIIEELNRNCLKSIFVEMMKIKKSNEDFKNENNIKEYNNEISNDVILIQNPITIINTQNENSFNPLQSDFNECFRQEDPYSITENFNSELEYSTFKEKENSYMNNLSIENKSILQEISITSEINKSHIIAQDSFFNSTIEDNITKFNEFSSLFPNDKTNQKGSLSDMISLAGYTEIIKANDSYYEQELNIFLLNKNDNLEIIENFKKFKKAIEELNYLKEQMGNNEFDIIKWLNESNEMNNNEYYKLLN